MVIAMTQLSRLVGKSQNALLRCVSSIHIALTFTSVQFALCLKAEKLTFCVSWHQEWMQARNPHNYPKEECKKVDLLLGTETWRDDWEKFKRGWHVNPILVTSFVESSVARWKYGVSANRIHEMRPIKDDGGRVLYHLALFSKSEKAKHFWEQASKYSNPQRDLF